MQCFSQPVLWKRHFLSCWYWNVVLHGLYSYQQRYLSSQWSKFVVDSLACALWVHNVLTPVMTHIIVDKSTDHAKPHSICKLAYSRQDNQPVTPMSANFYYKLFKKVGFNISFSIKNNIQHDWLIKAWESSLFVLVMSQVERFYDLYIWSRENTVTQLTNAYMKLFFPSTSSIAHP